LTDNGPPSAILAAAQARPEAAAPEDRLLKLRKMVAEGRHLQLRKEWLESKLKETNQAIEEMTFKTLPDFFDEARVPSISVEGEGDEPGFEAVSMPYYRANIASDWDQERRASAFAYLAEQGAEDLIKTDVIVAFPRGEHDAAKQFAEYAETETGQSVSVKEGVAWATLTSWLKESVEKHGFVPDLEKIGGQVGRQVKIKPLKGK